MAEPRRQFSLHSLKGPTLFVIGRISESSRYALRCLTVEVIINATTSTSKYLKQCGIVHQAAIYAVIFGYSTHARLPKKYVDLRPLEVRKQSKP